MIFVEKPCITLAACRANAGLSQKEMAAAIGVDPGTIFNWENGKTEPNISTLIKISEISNVPVGLIFLPER